MPPLITPVYFLAAGLLVMAGVGKALRPRPTAQALYAAGIAAPGFSVRLLGIVEIAMGTVAAFRPAPWSAALVAVAYALFAGFIGFLLIARPSVSSCGCAGAKAVPPSWLHAGMNLAAAGVAIVVAAVGTVSLPVAITSMGVAAIPASVGLVTAGWLTAVVAAEVPQAIRTWTSPTHHERAVFGPDRHRRADVALATAGVDAGHPSLWPDHDPGSGLPLDALGRADVRR